MRLDLPKEVNVDPVRFGRPLPRSLQSSRVARKARESLLPGTSGTLSLLARMGSGKRGVASFGDPGAIPGLRHRRPSRPFHAFFGLCHVCVPVSLSLFPSWTLFLSPSPTSTSAPFPQPPSAGDQDASAIQASAEAAERLRGRGGDGSQEAGLVVIFGYLAV